MVPCENESDTHALQEIKTKVDEVENQTRDFENKEAENTQTLSQKSQEKKKRIPQKDQDSLRSFWDNLKHTNIHIMEVPVEEREQGIENLCEKMMTKNFPNLVKEVEI